MAGRVEWPEGVKCPVVLSFDVDAELLWKVWLRGTPSLIDVSQGVYGPRVGLPRVLKMLKRDGIKGTFFVPGLIAERYPEEIAQISKDGHEVAHHGYEHEDCSKLGTEAQRRMIRKGSDALERVTGRRPRGFRLIPGKHTLKLLAQMGFLYDSVLMDDDVPYLVTLDRKRSELVELPVCFSFNDTSYFAYTFGMAKPLLTPREVEQVYKDEFDAMYAEGGYCMFMLHPQVIGRASRLAMLERTIEYMKSKEGVWFATAEQVAEYCKGALK
jgi:peptidoglycan/xylan/chitin deacetylase (PgdA/CDA1 family)